MLRCVCLSLEVASRKPAHTGSRKYSCHFSTHLVKHFFPLVMLANFENMQVDKPDFICSRTPFSRLYLSPDSHQAKATSTICTSCGGRQLLTSYISSWDKSSSRCKKYKPRREGPKCTAIQANKKQIRWLLKHRDETWRHLALWEARVDETRETARKQRPEGADLREARLEAGWDWPHDYISCDACCGPARVNVPWDSEVHAGRGVQLLSRAEVEAAEALTLVKWMWPESMRLEDEWQGGGMQRICLKDFEGSYTVRHAKPRRRRNPKAKPVMAVEDRSEEQVDLEEGVGGDIDDFELVSIPESWYLVCYELGSDVGD